MSKFSTALLFLMITACSNTKNLAPPASISANDTPTVKKLYTHYNQWRGVKYREGGMSKKGVDCSGFVHLAYKQKLHKKIPRSTEMMSESGKKIQPGKLRPGDVVFFKTGWKARHVGIYVGKGEFIHASSSRGVMKSRLNNPYWKDAYWMSRRY
ncbi:MAG: NlpC/P60 family protein [Gammaproteobacteria bacterium]|nr:NlpC/P60 family protein [Gammaproteobacteria bacterium]